MNQYKAILCENGIWRSICPLRIEPSKSDLPRDLLNDIINTMAGRPLSLEIALYGKDHDSDPELLIVLRSGTKSQKEAEESISICSDIIIKKLCDAGMIARHVQDDDELINEIEQFYCGKKSLAFERVGFYPKDTMTHQYNYRIPGQYSSNRIKKLDWSKISSAVSHYSDSFFSVIISNIELPWAKNR